MLNWVFAYGSNMATDDLTRRIVDDVGSADGLVRVESANAVGSESDREISKFRSRMLSKP